MFAVFGFPVIPYILLDLSNGPYSKMIDQKEKHKTVRGSFTEDSFDKGHMDLFSQRKNKLRILRILLDSF